MRWMDVRVEVQGLGPTEWMDCIVLIKGKGMEYARITTVGEIGKLAWQALP